MSLSLVRLRPDMAAFYRIAARRGFLPPGDDPGYALHAGLTAAFGTAAPRPFALRTTSMGTELLGYTTATSAEMAALARLAPAGEMSDLAETLLAAPPEVKPFPEIWPVGLRLVFQVRVRPVARTRPDGRDGGHREVDIYAHSGTRRQAQEDAEGAAARSREQVYAAWLQERMERGGGAIVEQIALRGYRRLRVLRRPRGQDGRRTVIVTDGPDATLSGVLRSVDGAAFGRLLAQGVGRHRSFGFGMILLSPVGTTEGQCQAPT